VRTTSFDFENPDAVFKVLVNHEEQYSLWPADLPVPGGWEETGTKGSKDTCDEYVREVWTDMRPKTLREAMERDARKQQEQQQEQQQEPQQEPQGEQAES